MKPSRLLVIAIIIMAAYIIFGMQKSGDNEKGTVSQPSNSAAFTEIEPGKNRFKLVIEAEAAAEIQAPVSVSEESGEVNENASNGKSCYLGPEKWNGKWKNGQVEGEFKKGNSEAPYPGYAKYVFDIPEDGFYQVWIRAYWTDKCADSVLVSVNDAKPVTIEDSTHKRWIWCPMRNAENDIRKVKMKAGSNSLVICNREDDLYFDQILIRAADGKWPDPTGIEK